MHLQTDLAGLIEQHLVEAVEVERVEIDGDGLLGIDQVILDTTLALILSIELEVLHHIAQQHARLQDLYLVLNTGGVGEEAQVLHIIQQVGGITLLLVVLHHEAARHLVHRTGIAQVKQRGGQTDNQRQEEPLPVEHQQRKQIGKTEPGILLGTFLHIFQQVLKLFARDFLFF